MAMSNTASHEVCTSECSDRVAKETSGDLWTYPAAYRVITTNGVVTSTAPRKLVMGAGIAKQAKDMFPYLPETLGKLVLERGNIPLLLNHERIITLPTKHHWKDASDIGLIVSGILLLVELVDRNKIQSVVMTRPGCGNGWLSWDDVRPEIFPLLDSRFTVLG